MGRLDRFVEAQEAVWWDVFNELLRGKKETCWMWFIFPQLRGLSHSTNGVYYAIDDLNMARDYLKHPVLGKRLKVCAWAAHDMPDVERVFGPLDTLKLKSSMELFHKADPSEESFKAVLDKHFRPRQSRFKGLLSCLFKRS